MTDVARMVVGLGVDATDLAAGFARGVRTIEGFAATANKSLGAIQSTDIAPKVDIANAAKALDELGNKIKALATDAGGVRLADAVGKDVENAAGLFTKLGAAARTVGGETTAAFDQAAAAAQSLATATERAGATLGAIRVPALSIIPADIAAQAHELGLAVGDPLIAEMAKVAARIEEQLAASVADASQFAKSGADDGKAFTDALQASITQRLGGGSGIQKEIEQAFKVNLGGATSAAPVFREMADSAIVAAAAVSEFGAAFTASDAALKARIGVLAKGTQLESTEAESLRALGTIYAALSAEIVGGNVPLARRIVLEGELLRVRQAAAAVPSANLAAAFVGAGGIPAGLTQLPKTLAAIGAGATTAAQSVGRMSAETGRFPASGQKAANAAIAVGFALSSIAAGGDKAEAGLRQALRAVAGFSGFFGGSGLIVAGVATAASAIVDLFERSRDEMKKTEEKFASSLAQMQKDADVIGPQVAMQLLDRGDATAAADELGGAVRKGLTQLRADSTAAVAVLDSVKISDPTQLTTPFHDAHKAVDLLNLQIGILAKNYDRLGDSIRNVKPLATPPQGLPRQTITAGPDKSAADAVKDQLKGISARVALLLEAEKQVGDLAGTNLPQLPAELAKVWALASALLASQGTAITDTSVKARALVAELMKSGIVIKQLVDSGKLDLGRDLVGTGFGDAVASEIAKLPKLPTMPLPVKIVPPDPAEIAGLQEAMQRVTDARGMADIAKNTGSSQFVAETTAALTTAEAAFRKFAVVAAASLLDPTLPAEELRKKIEALAAALDKVGTGVKPAAGDGIAKIADGIHAAVTGVRGLTQVAQAIGKIGDAAAHDVDSVLSLVDSVTTLADAIATSNIPGMIAGSVGALGAIASFFGSTAADKEANDLLKANNEVLAQVGRDLRGFGDNLRSQQKVALALHDPGVQSAQATWLKSAITNPVPRADFDKQLLRFGLSIADLTKIAKDYGITLFNGNQVVAGSFEALDKVIQGVIDVATHFANTMEGMTALADLTANVFDVTDPMAKLGSAIKVFSDVFPDAAKKLFDGVDIHDPAALKAAEKKWLAAYTADSDFLKKLGISTADFIQLVTGIEDPLDALAGAADTATHSLLNIPKGLKMEALRFDATLAKARSAGAPAAPPPPPPPTPLPTTPEPWGNGVPVHPSQDIIANTDAMVTLTDALVLQTQAVMAASLAASKATPGTDTTAATRITPPLAPNVTVNVAPPPAPVITVNIPEMRPPDITVNVAADAPLVVPAPVVNVAVAAADAPRVTVTVAQPKLDFAPVFAPVITIPPIGAPNVTVTLPNIDFAPVFAPVINLPEMKAEVVSIDLDRVVAAIAALPAPVVNVTVAAAAAPDVKLPPAPVIPATVVNVAAPNIPAPVVNVTVSIDLDRLLAGIASIPAPVVSVAVAAADAPVVNVSVPDFPKIPASVVTLNVPAPIVNVDTKASEIAKALGTLNDAQIKTAGSIDTVTQSLKDALAQFTGPLTIPTPDVTVNVKAADAPRITVNVPEPPAIRAPVVNVAVAAPIVDVAAPHVSVKVAAPEAPVIKLPKAIAPVISIDLDALLAAIAALAPPQVTVSVAAADAPIVNVAVAAADAPVFKPVINLPDLQAPDITITVPKVPPPKTPIINVAAAKWPDVTITLPKVKPPAAPVVRVNVAAARAADVTVTVPKLPDFPTPIVNVRVPASKPADITITTPAAPMAVVSVKIPKLDFPIINVAAPKVAVRVAAARAPVVNVAVAAADAPSVSVSVPDFPTIPEPRVSVSVEAPRAPDVTVTLPVIDFAPVYAPKITIPKIKAPSVHITIPPPAMIPAPVVNLDVAAAKVPDVSVTLPPAPVIPAPMVTVNLPKVPAPIVNVAPLPPLPAPIVNIDTGALGSKPPMPVTQSNSVSFTIGTIVIHAMTDDPRALADAVTDELKKQARARFGDSTRWPEIN